MYKHSPSRNQRSKGFKVKHGLQICLLVAVCFWLIYQVKHSHDKKREFDGNAKRSLVSEQKDGVVKLGRKYLNPKMEEKVIKTGKHDEEDDDDTAIEEEENKHETEELDDNKTDEKEEEDDDVDEGRDGGEENDNHDQENSDTDNDQEVDVVDDQKEQENVDEQELEDKDAVDNNGQTENDDVSKEHNKKGDITNIREAREENYKADDASSAVTHDTQITIPDNQTRIMGKSNQQAEVSELEHQNQSINPDEVGTGQNPSVKVEGSETANNGSYLASTTVGQSETATATLNRTDESKVHRNNNNSTAARIEPQELPLAGWNMTFSEQNQDLNVVDGQKNTRNGSKFQVIDNKMEGNSTLPRRNDPHDFSSTTNIDPSFEEMKKSDGTEYSIAKVRSNVSANVSGKTEEPFDDTKDNGAAKISETLDASNSETSDESQADPIDSSDTTNSLEGKYIE